MPEVSFDSWVASAPTQEGAEWLCIALRAQFGCNAVVVYKATAHTQHTVYVQEADFIPALHQFCNGVLWAMGNVELPEA